MTCYLHYNSITSLPSGVFNGLNSLTILNLTKSHHFTFTPSHSIFHSFCFPTNWPTFILMLSKTSLVSTFFYNPLSSSFPFNTTIALQYNSLKSLHQSTFSDLKRLTSFLFTIFILIIPHSKTWIPTNSHPFHLACFPTSSSSNISQLSHSSIPIIILFSHSQQQQTHFSSIWYLFWSFQSCFSSNSLNFIYFSLHPCSHSLLK